MKKLLIALAITVPIAAQADFKMNSHGVIYSSAAWDNPTLDAIKYEDSEHVEFVEAPMLSHESVVCKKDREVISVNGQDIKFWSTEYNNKCYYAAASKAGKQFIDDAFKNGSSVTFKGRIISAMGFTKALAAQKAYVVAKEAKKNKAAERLNNAL
ncbi:exported hypothetical protein [Vibrio crassostreae]|uniref:hypothetical protein n=1 Tax=Vibrio crassostreae TaxID=246167 RepID=UPI000F4A819D|nr:hypothetical protein [Vibrio crassostreae]ROR22193.1 hypothetical protein EDB67_10921 [Vibrio crassostreae]TCN66899.1 hypothetical protein EDB60_11090 [Vibrio crassostreae]CAK1697101.1 exported hypothetical protein [Vibrio crassostreae]CAK1700280.1 exported hypothetical protein [Vibrio crassostreae]CAK1718002.1 exported hypothetical protein [Vibrio crassostreae]